MVVSLLFSGMLLCSTSQSTYILKHASFQHLFSTPFLDSPSHPDPSPPSRQPLNPPSYTLSKHTRLLNIPFSHILSTVHTAITPSSDARSNTYPPGKQSYPINTPFQHIISTHPIHTLYQYNLQKFLLLFQQSSHNLLLHPISCPYTIST